MQNEVINVVFPQILIEKALKISDCGGVYLVRDKDTHQRYIYRVFSGSSDVYRRLCMIQCTHLPQIHKVKEENGMVYILEEYVQGDTLAFLLEGGTLSTDQAKKIMIHLCHGLEILHSLGAIHRDIKPENVIIRGSEAVLIDFDVSRLYKQNSTSDTRVMGTTGYAAPEQYGFSQTDARADIYSLGILLNEMLTGQHPSRKLAEGEFRSVIEKCTQINADQRYASVTQLSDALIAQPERKSHGKKWIPMLLIAVLLFAGMFLLRKPASQEISSEVPQPQEVTAATEAAPAAPTAGEQFQSERVRISENPWQGTQEPYGTPFDYDLDGDGEAEHYLFGMDNDITPIEGPIYEESISAGAGARPGRTLWPCVWQVMDDDSLVEAPEFSQLLTDASTRIWRVDDFLSEEPEAWTVLHSWPEAVNVRFSIQKDGLWIFDLSAKLGDLELTAVSQLNLIRVE